MRIGLLAWLCCAACATRTAHSSAAATEALATWMTGTFSSAAQAEADPQNFFAIRLSVARIWPARSDGPWLYVEQAAESSLAKPYRQRVYRVVRLPNGTLRSKIYSLPGDPLAYAGAWRTPARFASLEPSALTERTGCAVDLVARGGAYYGSTQGKGCASSLGGAAYATSVVTVRRDLLTSWDRGFDRTGKQVWGATVGPYRFVRQ